MNRIANPIEGFSTLEVLIAFAILSTVVALSLTSYVQGLGGFQNAQDRLAALSLIDQLDFNTLGNIEQRNVSFGEFTLNSKLTTLGFDPLANMIPKKLTIRVSSKTKSDASLLEMDTVVLTRDDDP
jgi:type II secretory pathway pseudopilin PulG